MATKITKAEMVMKSLKKLGLQPELEEDGDVSFNYQGEALYVAMEDEDVPFISIVNPVVGSIETDDEKRCAMFVCDRINRTARLVKAFTCDDMGRIEIDADMYYDSQKGLDFQIMRGLRMMGFANGQIIHQMENCLKNVDGEEGDNDQDKPAGQEVDDKDSTSNS